MAAQLNSSISLKKTVQKKLPIPVKTMAKWQKIVDLIAEIVVVPAGLIRRVDPPQIEVFVSSSTEGNPYEKGGRADLDTGLYCETVMATRNSLLVSDASKDPDWDHNSDLELGMVSYLGFPIEWPDGEIFGTICVLDNKEKRYPSTYQKLMEEFKGLVEIDLKLIIDSLEQEQIDALREAELRYRMLFNKGYDAKYVHGITKDGMPGKFIDANDIACRRLGYAREELLHLSPQDIDDPESETDVPRLMERFYRNKRVQFEQVHRRKDGKKLPVEINAHLFKINGQPTVLSIVRDITNRKRAEAKIERQTAVLEAINAVFQEALTCETEEELGKTCLSVAENLTGSKFGLIGELNPEGLFDTIAISNPGWDACDMAVTDARKYIKSMPIRGIDRSTIRDEKSRIVNEDEIATHPDRVGIPKGHPKLTAFLGVPLKHEGQTIGMIGLGNKPGGYQTADREAVENLAVAIVQALKNKRAEDALLKSETKFRTLFEESRDPIYITSVKGTFIDNNEAWCDLFGYTKEEFNQINAVDLFSNAADRKRFQKAIEETGHVKDLEVRYGKKDGAEMICLETATVLKDAGDNVIGYQGSIRDMTERIKTRQQLEDALQKAEQADLVKTLFLANMSHEIRTPLNAILGFNEILEDSVGEKITPEEKLFFDTIHHSGDRLLRTIQEILDISQIEAGTYHPEKKLHNLNSIIESLLLELQPVAENKNLNLSFTSDIPDALVKVDEYTITNALINLIDNAIKYTEKGQVIISLKAEGHKLEMSIADTGIGMSEDYQKHLFEIFSQESVGYTKRFQGIGLGLALTKRYMDLNGVGIAVQSTQELGTTITLTFRRLKKKPPVPTRVAKEKVITEEEIVPTKYTVLFVDDDPNSQKLVQFSTKGVYNTCFAVSVAGAKQQLEKYPVDLILLDLSLIGDEDGLDLARHLRQTKRWRDLPIIALTAHAFPADEENCIKAGCNDFLTKPTERHELVTKIEKFVNRRQ